VQVWGAQSTPQGDRVWLKNLKLSQEVKPTLRGAEFFSQTYPRIVAVDLDQKRRLVAFERSSGPELVFTGGNGVTSWAWGPGVEIVSVALGEGQNVAACGFKNGAPFLWKNGEEISAPEGWRGLLSNLIWKGSEIVAVGRGAPGQKNPVQALLFDGNFWKTLSVSSVGNFPSFVGILPDKKVEILGCEALRPDGYFQVWRWEAGNLFKWKTKEKLLSLGPVAFSTGLLAVGIFSQEGKRVLQTWDGKKTKQIESWPLDGVPRVISTTVQGRLLLEKTPKLAP
jgi:hypothetical protein